MIGFGNGMFKPKNLQKTEQTEADRQERARVFLAAEKPALLSITDNKKDHFSASLYNMVLCSCSSLVINTEEFGEYEYILANSRGMMSQV